MSSVSLDVFSQVRGLPIAVSVDFPDSTAYQQMQFEIFDSGVRNPSSIMGFGAGIEIGGGGKVTASIDTKHLVAGTYELKLIRFHSGTQVATAPPLDLIGGRDYSRLFFEVIADGDSKAKSEDLKREVLAKERNLEEDFLSPIDIRTNSEILGVACAVFVFIKCLLLGTPMRFEHYELAPTGAGLDSKDEVEFINTFFRERTSVGITFPYDDNLRQHSRQTQPVCMLYFPNLIADNCEKARDHSREIAEQVLLTLSLLRGASGSVFEIVVLNRKSNEALKYGYGGIYAGNLMTGSMAGEDAQRAERYNVGISGNQFNRFLTRLFKEALAEVNSDFQYVRYWQILEVLAESRNYPEGDPLIDYERNPMFSDDGKPRKQKNAVEIVFCLLRDSGMGTTTQTWKNVNVWFAFRTAVAHHGALGEYEKLNREEVKKWARAAAAEIQTSNSHDVFLWTLREDVKLLLMKELVRSTESH